MEPERIGGRAVGEFISQSQLFSKRPTGQIMSMRFDNAVYLHVDGRVGELYRSGNMAYLFVWRDVAEYYSFRANTPYNVRKEF